MLGPSVYRNITTFFLTNKLDLYFTMEINRFSCTQQILCQCRLLIDILLPKF